VAGSAAAASAALIAGTVMLSYADRHRVHGNLTSWDFSDVFANLANLAVPVVGFVLAVKRPANRLGWLFLAAGLALGLSFFSTQYAQHALVAVPGSWPAGRAAAWLANWIWAIPFAVLAFVFLLFPAGQLRSPRWRVAARLVAGAYALATVDLIVHATRLWRHPFTTYTQSSNPPYVNAALVLMIAAMAVSVAAVVVRFAYSSGEERLQLKWFAAAALLVIATIIPSFLTDVLIFGLVFNLALLCLWVAIGIAILKYRLDGIDIVISKAVLYGSLAVFITAVYAGLVVGVGTAAGTARCWRRWRRRWWRSPSSRCASGPGGWPTASCTAGGPPRIRCCPTSPTASAAPTPTRTSCRRWRRSWRRGPAPSGSWCGCGWMTSSTRRPLPRTAAQLRRRRPLTHRPLMHRPLMHRRLAGCTPIHHRLTRRSWIRCRWTARRCRRCPART
jgi:hypothetical protein